MAYPRGKLREVLRSGYWKYRKGEKPLLNAKLTKFGVPKLRRLESVTSARNRAEKARLSHLDAQYWKEREKLHDEFDERANFGGTGADFDPREKSRVIDARRFWSERLNLNKLMSEDDLNILVQPNSPASQKTLMTKQWKLKLAQTMNKHNVPARKALDLLVKEALESPK